MNDFKIDGKNCIVNIGVCVQEDHDGTGWTADCYVPVSAVRYERIKLRDVMERFAMYETYGGAGRAFVRSPWFETLRDKRGRVRGWLFHQSGGLDV